MVLLFPGAALCGSDKLVDDSAYKENKLQKCNIKDYRDMVKGDGVDWVWVKPGEKLGAYKTKAGAVLNKSDMHSSSMVSKGKVHISGKFFRSYQGIQGDADRGGMHLGGPKVYAGKALDTVCRRPRSAGRHGC